MGLGLWLVFLGGALAACSGLTSLRLGGLLVVAGGLLLLVPPLFA